MTRATVNDPNTATSKNNNTIRLHPLTLSFASPIDETNFQDFYFSHYIHNMRVSMLFGILIWGLFGLLEMWFYPKETLWPLLLIRYVAVWPFMIASVLLTYLPDPKKHVSFGIAIGITACAFGTIMKFAILPAAYEYSPNPSLITIFLYAYAVMRARFIWAAITGLAVIFFYELVAIAVRPIPTQELVTNTFFLIMANVIGMYVCYSLEKFARKDFLYSKSLRVEKKRTEETNARLTTEITERCLIEEKLREHQNNLEKLVHERTKDLEATQHEMIHMLGMAAEFRDCETGQHIKRMSHYCVALAMAVGLDEKDCELLFYASQMHDIGKLGIPDSILLKPGKLTPQEWEMMKRHTTIGAEILAKDKSSLLATARTIALLHHERWNGSGYPSGIEKDHIPLLARIVCLCDVFDALTSDRPYKKAWSAAEALKEIERLSGECFDPVLVDKFKEIFPEILKIAKKFSDDAPSASGSPQGS